MQRTCVGCRSTLEASELVRLVVSPEGEVVPDLAGGSQGRGAWVHARPECIRRAVPDGLCRTFRTRVSTTPAELLNRLKSSAERRVRGLVMAARRARKAEVGAVAVELAVKQQRAELVLVATDARASAELNFLTPLVAEGKARAFATKAAFGEWLARPDTALVAFTDPGLARAADKAIGLTLLGGAAANEREPHGTVATEAG